MNDSDQTPSHVVGGGVLLFLNAVTALMLLGACTGRHPYSYYTLLRLTCFAAFVYTSVWGLRKKATIVFAPLAVIFNPLLPLRLTRGTWGFIDAVALALTIGFTAYLLIPAKR